VFTDEGGPPTPRRILKHCLARWPVVLFLHGQEPCTITNYNRTWTTIPASLARSGYVVIAPQHSRQLPQDNSGVPFVAGFIDWVRNTWEHARWTDKRRDAVAVVGHSYGALLAARVATLRSDISACALLSGPFAELNDRNSLLSGLGRPTFYMFSPTENFANVNDGGLWDSFEYPKYVAEFGGEHFDYITQPPGCGKPVGPCSLIKPVADRPGHDRRYCLDTTKLRVAGWAPQVAFDTGLQQTVEWYRDNEWWWRPIKEQDQAFRDYYRAQYGNRAGA
jgi:pimeloyl-ACP methyl ester carboxylesterase